MRGVAALAAALLLAGAPAAAQSSPGERAFQRCYACHDLAPDAPKLQGPRLLGVFGRRAGAPSDFDYSDAMKLAGARGLVWTPATLDRYLEDPEAFVPGGSMAGVWMRDAGERRALIEWLETATR